LKPAAKSAFVIATQLPSISLSQLSITALNFACLASNPLIQLAID